MKTRKKKHVLTPEQWARAQKMRHDGKSFAAIGEAFGVRAATAHSWFEPGADPTVPRRQPGKLVRPRKTDRAPAHPLQSIPADTRGLTGRIMGDPLPGRSALDKRSRPSAGFSPFDSGSAGSSVHGLARPSAACPATQGGGDPAASSAPGEKTDTAASRKLWLTEKAMQTAFGAPGMQADLDFIERRLRELSLEAAE